MKRSRLPLLLLVPFFLCLGLFLVTRFYLDQKLYLPQVSDQELIEALFETGSPGYGGFEIIESQGEGIRRIPREIELLVDLNSYPDSLQCEARIYYDQGDPMALISYWRRHECIGNDLWIKLTHDAARYGLNDTDCHAGRIQLLLAQWIQQEVIQPEWIRSADLRASVLELIDSAGDAPLGQPFDGGLFEIDRAVMHPMVEEEEVRYTAYVLRCDGTLDAYLLDGYGKTRSVVELGPGDVILPDTVDDP